MQTSQINQNKSETRHWGTCLWSRAQKQVDWVWGQPGLDLSHPRLHSETQSQNKQKQFKKIFLEKDFSWKTHTSLLKTHLKNQNNQHTLIMVLGWVHRSMDKNEKHNYEFWRVTRQFNAEKNLWVDEKTVTHRAGHWHTARHIPCQK